MSVWPAITECRYPRWLSLCELEGTRPGAVYSDVCNIQSRGDRVARQAQLAVEHGRAVVTVAAGALISHHRSCRGHKYFALHAGSARQAVAVFRDQRESWTQHYQ